MSDASLAEVWKAIETLRNDNNVDKLVWQKIQSEMSDLIAAINKLSAGIGETSTDEHGNPIGTGIKGDVMRIRIKVDERFSAYDGWKKYAKGAMAAATVSIVIVWWLVQDRVHFLK